MISIELTDEDKKQHESNLKWANPNQFRLAWILYRAAFPNKLIPSTRDDADIPPLYLSMAMTILGDGDLWVDILEALEPPN